MDFASSSARGLAIVWLLAAVAGCGGTAADSSGNAAAPAAKAPAPLKETTPKAENAAPLKRPNPSVPAVAADDDESSGLPPLIETPSAQLLPAVTPDTPNLHEAAPAPEIDDERVAAHGIRKLQGKHLTLYTDVKSSPAVDELPEVFDQAVPQWRDYFGMPAEKVDRWHVWGYIVQDKEKFRQAGLWPDDLPPIINGFQRGKEFWLFEQPTDYYRRHLMLHEGTHAAMYHWLGSAGPPWYTEGMAEYFGTHRWEDGKLTTGYTPRTKDDAPGWGRVKLIKDAYADHKALQLTDVLRLPREAHRDNAAYAWSWAAVAFFEGNPKYQGEFRKLRDMKQPPNAEFSAALLTDLREHAGALQDEWQLFIAHHEYGYDVARNALDVIPARALPPAGATVEISAERGWQSTGLVLEAGKSYRLEASGRYQIGQSPKVWWCEPQGVTIRYHRGKPLGRLLAAVRNDEQPAAVTPLLNPVDIGAAADLTPRDAGTLWLKINEHEAEWSDNHGSLTVRIEPR